VAKISLPSSPSDFRPNPNSIFSVLSKGFKRLIHGQILVHERSNYLSTFLSEFMRSVVIVVLLDLLYCIV
jgi:hypothetical protein